MTAQIATTRQSPLLSLPREIRDDILDELFFSGIGFDSCLPNGRKDIVTICPTDTGAKKFPVAILRVCRQLQHEGQDALYRKVKLDLKTDRVSFIQNLGSSICSRILHLVISNLNLTDSLSSGMPVCEWKTLTSLMSSQFGSLQTLQLNLSIAELPPSDSIWGEFSVQSEWIRALLYVRDLRDFKINITSTNPDYQQDQCVYLKQTYPLLRESVTSASSKSTDVRLHLSPEPASPFPFLKLPHQVQQQIIRLTALPASKVLHPCSNPAAVDNTTILPLLLTSRATHQTTEQIVYGEAIFSSCDASYQKDFKRFMQTRSPRQKQLMKRFYCKGLDRWIDRGFDKWRYAEFPHLRHLEEEMRWHMDHPCFHVVR